MKNSLLPGEWTVVALRRWGGGRGWRGQHPLAHIRPGACPKTQS